MLIITIEEEFFDEANEKFITNVGGVLELEHSLVSLSKWESKYQRPFISSQQKTSDEILFYILCMIISPVGNSEILSKISQKNLNEIMKYIDSKESATTFGMMPQRKGRGEVITSELIYYWMVDFGIPWEAENWHLNRLFSLIRICNIKNSKPKKMSPSEIAAQHREINAERRARLGTTG